jgi:probable phosphoglycerate mutase
MDHVQQPLYLVRHGESEWNARRLIQGQTGHPGLTPLGREQARIAACRIRADLGVAARAVALASSDLVRAEQTAQILAQVLGGTIRTDPRLREQHLGSWQGLTVEQAGAAEAGGAGGFLGGESARRLRERMVEALAAVDRRTVNVLVSHGRAIRQAVGHATGLTEDAAARLRVGNGAVARLQDGRVYWLA